MKPFVSGAKGTGGNSPVTVRAGVWSGEYEQPSGLRRFCPYAPVINSGVVPYIELSMPAGECVYLTLDRKGRTCFIANVDPMLRQQTMNYVNSHKDKHTLLERIKLRLGAVTGGGQSAYIFLPQLIERNTELSAMNRSAAKGRYHKNGILYRRRAADAAGREQVVWVTAARAFPLSARLWKDIVNYHEIINDCCDGFIERSDLEKQCVRAIDALESLAQRRTPAAARFADRTHHVIEIIERELPNIPAYEAAPFDQ